MAPFLIAGIVGSSIFAFIITLGITASLGIFNLVGLFYALPFGLLSGCVGYGFFKLLKSTSPYIKGGLIAISAVLGFGLTLLMYILFV
jgi:hypothetical protein